MLQPACAGLSSVRWQQHKRLLRHSSVPVFLCSCHQNGTRTEEGASSLCLSSAGAHMTEAAAADYRFSCGGGAPSHSFILSFSLRSINLFRAPGCQLIVSPAFSSSSQLSFFMLLVLSCHTVASLFTAA